MLSGAALSASARAEFPYGTGGTRDRPTHHTAPGQVPDDLEGDDSTFKFAATPEDGNLPVNAQRSELCGIRGGHLVDEHATYAFPPCPPDPGGTRPVRTAWQTTTGRPDVTIAVLDSGIEWNNVGAMRDLRTKVRLNRRELPRPRVDRGPLDPTLPCPSGGGGSYDLNGDGAVNLPDYACDRRVKADDRRRAGPVGMLTPQDVLMAFSDGSDADRNGFADDIAGWDFMDDDNDAYDDVQYGHGTGEAIGSSAEADNGGATGSCPNCTFIPMRVGDSFVADVNRFAQATIYAVDNDGLVIQEALGTLNNTKLARDAVDYAYAHGVAVIASAADEAAQHHNYPSSLPHTIVVNSVRNYTQETTIPKSYVRFNGCTNFSSKITLAIPSTSCSSDATGVGSGMAGLVYSAALNARDAGALEPNRQCRRVGGGRCVISANEVRQLMASGTALGVRLSDDVNLASGNPGQTEAAFSCHGLTPAPSGCTDPNNPALVGQASLNHPVGPVQPARAYPSRRGHDQFYGWGRVNMVKVVQAITEGNVPPEVEITAPEWFEQIDPGQAGVDVKGQIDARGAAYTCELLVAPGSYPNDDRAPTGDFVSAPFASPGRCDGTTQHTGALRGTLGQLSISQLKSHFPAGTDFEGPENNPANPQTSNGRPNTEPMGFVVKVVATRVGQATSGEDRRNLYLHRDRDMLPGFPKQLRGDGESSPLFADLDGDNRNELVFATAEGEVHARRADGGNLPGWPVRGDRLRLHRGGRPFRTGAISGDVAGPFLGSVAASDLDQDGRVEVVGADFEGKVYAWDGRGRRQWTREARLRWSGKPLRPFVNVRQGKGNRTQHGFLGSPVLADLDAGQDDAETAGTAEEGAGRDDAQTPGTAEEEGAGRGDGRGPDGEDVEEAGADGAERAGRRRRERDDLEIVLAGMDRHVYVFNRDGSSRRGWPALVVDRSKVESIDPTTHAVRFDADALGDDEPLNQGAIIDTPGVADITGDERPEVLIGTNEEYLVEESGGKDGKFNAGVSTTTSINLLAPSGLVDLAHGRLYALKPEGRGKDALGDAGIGGRWPVKVGRVFAELLPVVGEGINGSPVVASFSCLGGDGDDGPKIGVIPDAGPGYIFGPDGRSCYGQEGGRDKALETDKGAGPNTDRVAIPAVGLPAFGDFGDGISFLAPVAGVIRALDLAIPEYQFGGQDFIGSWKGETGEYRPGYPARVNDLQFLTGPVVADIDGDEDDQEAVGGTAYLDLAAYTGEGTPVPGFPKLTSDWMVATPLVGSFGTRDVDDDARKVVVALTRSGTVLAYRTDAPACSPGSSPRFHHDNANSGDFERDAISPGRPHDAEVSDGELSFEEPGDDLLCGTAESFEIVVSDRPITAADFRGGRLVANPPQPQGAGTRATYELPDGGGRYVAIRAVDEQGNVGRFRQVRRPR